MAKFLTYQNQVIRRIRLTTVKDTDTKELQENMEWVCAVRTLLTAPTMTVMVMIDDDEQEEEEEKNYQDWKTEQQFNRFWEKGVILQCC
jgi:hypothetical protein